MNYLCNHPKVGGITDLDVLLTTHADITTAWVLAFIRLKGFEEHQSKYQALFGAM